MSLVAKLLLIIIISVLCGCSAAPNKETVTKSIKKIMPPNYEVLSVNQLKEVPGLIEVAVKMDKQPVIFYMDLKGKYVFSGSVVELENRKNLTADAISALTPQKKEVVSSPVTQKTK